MDKNLALMDRIMGEITQAGEWDKIQMSDPQISTADARWHGAMEQIRDLIPDGLYDELCDAHVTEIAAIDDKGGSGDMNEQTIDKIRILPTCKPSKIDVRTKDVLDDMREIVAICNITGHRQALWTLFSDLMALAYDIEKEAASKRLSSNRPKKEPIKHAAN